MVKQLVSSLRSFFQAYRWRALMPGLLILVSGGWVADGLKGEVLFADWTLETLFAADRWIGLGIAMPVFVVASLWLYSYRQDFALIRSLSQNRCSPHRSLILLVSPPNRQPLVEGHKGPFRIGTGDGGAVECKGDALDADIASLDALRWNWQQLLRGIGPHVESVERVFLVGSSGDRGSFGHLQSCERMLRRYLPPPVVITRDDDPVDFENFNDLTRRLRRIIEAERKHGMRDEDVVIDITGGPKMASVAGSAVTFSTEVTFQYVQTRAPFDVYAYDVVQRPPER